MNFIADMHTHTIASQHAYSTLYENLIYAKKRNLKAIAITDHTKAVKDAALDIHFKNLKSLPEKCKGIKIFRGAEVNITDWNGNVDLPINILKNLDFAIASFHDTAIKHGAVKDHTKAYLHIVKNPFIDCLGHSGNPKYPYDYEKVIAACAKHNKIVEINEGSFTSRKGSAKNCLTILRLCSKYGVYVSVNSDSHFASNIGKFKKSTDLINAAHFNKDLILNLNYGKLNRFIKYKKKQKETLYKKIARKGGMA